jgi:AcrR family transcriptional regulator
MARSSRGPARDASETRQRIIDVGRTLFCSQGYTGTPLRAISDALGVTKAALYYHFRAKDDLLGAIVSPLLDRIDEMLDAAPDATLPEPEQRRAFLVTYVDELTTHADIIALLIRDHGVGQHPLGRRFASQHTRMRELLGAGDGAANVIRTTTALRALELAVIEFSGTEPTLVRDTALTMAFAVLESGTGSR